MTNARWLLQQLAGQDDDIALIHHGRRVTRGALRAEVDRWTDELGRHAPPPGSSVGLCADFALQSCALLLSLIGRGHVVVPLSPGALRRHPERLDVTEAAAVLSVSDHGRVDVSRRHNGAGHNPLLRRLRRAGHAGLVLFTSGSSGRSKAALLDFERLLQRFRRPGRAYRTITFLLFDHIGGLNTLFHVVCAGGTVVPVRDRNPHHVCGAIAEHRVQLLPTTPTFLNMLLISGAHEQFDLGSLEMITYGTEPMPHSTLRALHRALPGVRLKQTYGLSELGILSTRSRDSGSLWVKMGGEGYELKVVDGTLRIRAEAAMLGYLDAPSPFDDQGWFDTGDHVEVDGEYLRVLGRHSDVINVGGQKVHAAEVESVLLELDNVSDVVVRARPNPVTTNVVAAVLTLNEPENRRELARRVRRHCKGRLAPFKVPAAVEVSRQPLHGERFKRRRSEV